MRTYYFISGLPRSGSTLLSSILNQNPEFFSDISTPLENICEMSIDIITDSHNNNVISESQRIDLIHGIFEGYYRKISSPFIFDLNRSWTKKTNLLNKVFPNTKILCPVRNISSIINSFETLFSKNPLNSHGTLDYKKSIFTRCNTMMNPDSGLIGSPLSSLQEGYSANPEMIHFVEYENLCKDPERTMRGVYNFLERPYYPHDFNNVEYSNEIFDMSCGIKNMHRIRRVVEYKPPKYIIPPDIINNYNNLKFW